jgi:hypothetical protein
MSVSGVKRQLLVALQWSGKQTTNKNPNLSTARLIVDFINSIDPKRIWRAIRER